MPKTVNDSDRLLGTRIAALRKAKGMSQTVLGNGLGVTFQQVQKYEKGQNRLSSGKLETVAGLLGVRVSDLFQGSDEEAAEGSVIHLLMTPGASDLLQAYASLDAEMRRALVVLARRGTAAPVAEAAA
ncbi:helix-turn-helix domain-containing protein [Methylobacterium aquaticum]|uniref:Predicted transcriptional regulators n=1 Tax=Methylobacterium aquaticum TaxID=270351 RepID=A0A0C6EWF5_9HYPH|nr:helix-turn-helix transcriptional regulator [Methylobacterium aquaticum]BAQ44356.1 predicted transcriptional regulators [Methylobacterium aquaticum]